MPQRQLPSTAWKRGIDERDTEHLLWALIEQARKDYFPNPVPPSKRKEEPEIDTPPLMTMKEVIEIIKEINREQEKKRKAGEEKKPAHQSADKALQAYRAASKKKTL